MAMDVGVQVFKKKRKHDYEWGQVWNTVEVDAMIADNSSGYGRMNGLVADKAGEVLGEIVFLGGFLFLF